MNHEIQYQSDDSESSTASDNEGIVFTEAGRKKTEAVKQANGNTQKRTKSNAKHDLETTEHEQEIIKPKKRRRTVEVSELPFHDEDAEFAEGIPQGRFRSRIWNDAMVSSG